MRVRPFMGAGADAVADGVGWLSGVSPFGDAGANELVEFGEAGTMARKRDGVVENFQQKVEQFVILGLQITWAGVFGEIRPIAVDTDPNFEKRGFIFLNRAITGGGEGGDSFAVPHQRNSSRQLHLTLAANGDDVH